MNQEEKLQQLLRLKRHEQPEEGWAEAFLEEFQRRRALRETVPPHPLTLWKERALAALEALRRPAVAWGAAAAYGAFMLLAWTWPKPDHAERTTVVITPKQPGPAQPGQGPGGMRHVNTPPQIVREVDHFVSPPVPLDMTVPVGSESGRLPQPDGKSRTPDQPRDVRSLIGPPLPEPEKR